MLIDDCGWVKAAGERLTKC